MLCLFITTIHFLLAFFSLVPGVTNILGETRHNCVCKAVVHRRVYNELAPCGVDIGHKALCPISDNVAAIASWKCTRKHLLDSMPATVFSNWQYKIAASTDQDEDSANGARLRGQCLIPF